MRIRLVLLLIVSALVLGAGCNNYDKLLKSTDADRQYQTAMGLYNRGKYHKAAPLLERALPLLRATQRGDSVHYYLFNSYYHDSEYLMAGYYAQQLAQSYPKSPFLEEALYMVAYSHYQQAPRYSLDQEFTIKGIASFEYFLERFPKSDRRVQASSMLQDLQGRLLEKSYRNARMYYDMGMYKAAVSALKYSLEQYPSGPYREEQLFLSLKSAYRLAERSVDEKKRDRYQKAVDEYYTFVSAYPDSRYSAEAKEYHTKAMEFLGRRTDGAAR